MLKLCSPPNALEFIAPIIEFDAFIMLYAALFIVLIALNLAIDDTNILTSKIPTHKLYYHLKFFAIVTYADI